MRRKIIAPTGKSPHCCGGGSRTISNPDDSTGDLAIRADLVAAEGWAWDWIARPGTWLTGGQRIAVAGETRNALDCALCAARKRALSPYTVDGAHDCLAVLSDAMVEVVHRLRTDSGRATRRWYGEVLASGVGDGEYVESLGLVAVVTGLDTFSRGIGRPLAPLPAARDGEPSRHRPPGARPGLAWVATLEPEDVGADDPDLYASVGPPYNIQKALSLVPETMLGFFDLDDAYYMPETAGADFAARHRTIDRDQIELIAARVAALNQCFY